MVGPAQGDTAKPSGPSNPPHRAPVGDCLQASARAWVSDDIVRVSSCTVRWSGGLTGKLTDVILGQLVN